MLQIHVHQKHEIVAFPIGEIDFTNSMLPENISSPITPYIYFFGSNSLLVRAHTIKLWSV